MIITITIMCKCESIDGHCDACTLLYDCNASKCFNSKGFTNKMRACASCYKVWKKCYLCDKKYHARGIKCSRCEAWHYCKVCGETRKSYTCVYPQAIWKYVAIDKSAKIMAKYIVKLYGIPQTVISVKVMSVGGYSSIVDNKDIHVKVMRVFTLDGIETVSVKSFFGTMKAIRTVLYHYFKPPIIKKDIAERNKKGYKYIYNHKLINYLTGGEGEKVSDDVKVYYTGRVN